MKYKKYQTVGTILKYETVGTILKYETVGTIPKSLKETKSIPRIHRYMTAHLVQ
jgi:hypothetical protein